ncbi:MAG: argininosuccinate synthase [Planctomycetes bacterium]|nr:argininosuccinate synthase [Planctomycetota bacterium]MBM4083238.1 argininosuccinate synthase [Planctomycetota bacterium]
MERVVLAYTGGLDTSVCIHWLKNVKGLRVVTFEADLGQGQYLEPISERALATGAEVAHTEDLRDTFAREYIFPALRANAEYESGNPLGQALSRPLIASAVVKKALDEGCRFVAHGCTPKGNDQARFEASIAALAPQLKIIAPQREWHLKTRQDELEYARKHSLPVRITKDSPYNIDRNLWCTSIIGYATLEDPWQEPPKDVFLTTCAPEDCPDKPTTVTIAFERGDPVSVDGKALSPVNLIELLNQMGGGNGVGRLDAMENRLMGLKSRAIYEAPAATVLHMAHRALEDMTLSRDVSHFKARLSQRYAELVYDGLWFGDLRRALDAFFLETQKYVTGEVRLKLYKGSCMVLGRRSPFSQYRRELVTYGPDDTFNRASAQGFLDVWSLPLRSEALQKRKGRA